MKKILIILGFISFFACNNQENEEVFIEKSAASLKDKYGADEYGMRNYVMAFLYRGPNRDLDSVKSAELQIMHLENIGRLAEAGKLSLAGPFMDTGDLRGIYIFNVDNIEEARKLTETDPAIQEGSLRMELKSWYGSAALVGVNSVHNDLLNENVDKNRRNMDKKRKKVTGIGGVFFKCKDPKATKAWYEENLGFKTNEYGAMFEFRSSDDPEQVGYTQWSPFNEKTEYFLPSQNSFMMNYRVENIEELVEELKQNGVNVLDSIASYEYGKFVHIIDNEGNKIELWEPVDQVFTNLYEGTTIK